MEDIARWYAEFQVWSNKPFALTNGIVLCGAIFVFSRWFWEVAYDYKRFMRELDRQERETGCCGIGQGSIPEVPCSVAEPPISSIALAASYRGPKRA